MIHYYDAKKRDGTCRHLCTKEYVSYPRTQWGKPVNTEVNYPVASPHNVTCPKCLEILIPKEQAKLNKMKAAFEAATGSAWV